MKNIKRQVKESMRISQTKMSHIGFVYKYERIHDSKFIIFIVTGCDSQPNPTLTQVRSDMIFGTNPPHSKHGKSGGLWAPTVWKDLWLQKDLGEINLVILDIKAKVVEDMMIILLVEEIPSEHNDHNCINNSYTS